ncbi:MAG: hypothetical protein EXR76_12525 [Myxococcales bacterium]|nr:hypothetical protein [Myxococcales bacterium]
MTWAQRLSFIGAALLLVAVPFMQLRLEADTDRAVAFAYHENEVRQELVLVGVDLKSLYHGLRGYVLSGEDTWLEPYTDAVKSLADRLRRLRFLLAESPLQRARLASIDEHLESYRAHANRVLALARAVVIVGEGRAIRVEMEATLHDLEAEEERRWGEQQQAAERASALTSALSIFGSTLALVLIAYSGLALRRTLNRLTATNGEIEWQRSVEASVDRVLTAAQGQTDLRAASGLLLAELALTLEQQHGVVYICDADDDKVFTLVSARAKASWGKPRFRRRAWSCRT